MPKETYYFSHDYNARNDKKISALVRDFKSSGYGIFWATCEMIHEEGGTLEFDDLTIDAIAKDINEDAELVKNIIENCVEKYKLFTKNDTYLKSNRIHRNLESKKEKKAVKAEAGRLGGIKSGESRRNENITKQSEAERSTPSHNEPNEIKEKEIKEKKILIKDFNTMPLKTDFNGVPQQYIDKSIELIFYTTQKRVPPDSVKGMWDIFKVQNLTGDNFYQNEGKVYSHFLNWIKTQKIDTSLKIDLHDMNKFI